MLPLPPSLLLLLPPTPTPPPPQHHPNTTPTPCPRTKANLPTSDLKFATDAKASKAGSKVTFGEFGRQEPWAVKELKLHFHHDKPFKRVRGAGCVCVWGGEGMMVGPAGALLAVVWGLIVKLAGSWDPVWCPEGKGRGLRGLGV